MPTVFAALCAGFVALLLVAEANGSLRLRAVAKSAASLSFVAFALAAGALDNAPSRLILAGLALSAAGDVLLLWRAKPVFLGGMAAFALAHGAYIAAFLAAGAQYRPGVAAAAAIMAWFCIVMGRWLWPHIGRMRAPVAAYCIIIAGMVVAAVAASLSTSEPRYAVGAVAFAISDVFVARARFVTESLANKLAGLPLYYGAQLVLASAV